MAAAATLYDQFKAQVLQAAFNFVTDTLKLALFTGTYVPNFNTDTFYSDIIANEVTGTGYTAGGTTLAGQAVAVTAANTWGTAWTATTAYNLGDIVRPATGNGFLYRCIVAGTSGAAAPAWPTTVGLSVVDSTATWTCYGTSVAKFSANNVTWSNATITARYAVLYKSTGVNTTSRLIANYDMGGNVSSTASTFTVNWSVIAGALDLAA